MVCPECGAENKPDARLCDLCGRALPRQGALAPEASRRRVEAEGRIRARRRGDAIATPILAVVIAALLGLVVWRFASLPKYVSGGKERIQEEYPVAALDRYLSTLESGDYAAAYALLVPDLQRRMTEAQFVQVYTSGQEPKPTGHRVKDMGEWDAEHAYLAGTVDGRPSYFVLAKLPEGWRVAWTPSIGRMLSLPPPLGP